MTRDEGQVTSSRSRVGQNGKLLSIPKFLRDYPEIATLLLDRLKMASDRSTPTVTLFFEAQVFKALLNDRGWRRSVFVTADDPNDAFRKLNRALMEEHPDWRKGRPVGD